MSTWMRRRIERSRERCGQQASQPNKPKQQTEDSKPRPDQQAAPTHEHSASS